MRTVRNIPGLLVDFPTVMNNFFNDDFLRPTALTRYVAKPAVNILKDENSYGIEVAAPGFEKENFTLRVENNQLIVEAEKKTEPNENTAEFTQREFSIQAFKRTFNLPENEVDEDAITANYVNGILKIVLPKREEAKPKAPKAIAIQ